jgi:hypothetical protein
VNPVTSEGGQNLLFEFPVNMAAGPKLSGEYVRREGPERRFVYIAVGRQAVQRFSPWSRRMKIDVHTIPKAMIDKAANGMILEAVINGTGKDGTPACATVPVKSWRAVAQ